MKVKSKTKYGFIFIVIVVFAEILVACTGTDNKNIAQQKPQTNSQASAFLKPPASFTDTLQVNAAAAVFYRPDPLQFEKIKAKINPQRLYGIMHEFESQMNNARNEIRQYWPNVKIIETDSARYVLFIKKSGQKTYIDLNTKNDICGLLLFDGAKDPEQADMMNIDTYMSFYFR